ncbi:hypothetical protein D1AOALGA4SA_2782 [Olavius algarvensis Delta 1 endosymbiont]|nr:hypothetical protein D1AOALGA4SA_2782 [Olavius algarvensis Delta 1 endosymbiont]
MDSIFIIFIETGVTRLSGFFSPAARGHSAEGRIILGILLILSNYFLLK